jgi:hypothetical protein
MILVTALHNLLRFFGPKQQAVTRLDNVNAAVAGAKQLSAADLLPSLVAAFRQLAAQLNSSSSSSSTTSPCNRSSGGSSRRAEVLAKMLLQMCCRVMKMWPGAWRKQTQLCSASMRLHTYLDHKMHYWKFVYYITSLQVSLDHWSRSEQQQSSSFFL